MTIGDTPQVDVVLPDGDLWVFGYGSLMWRPAIPFEERHPARGRGRHRALCVWSWWHRGSRERPGLVMGLDRGGTCIGRAYRVAARDRAFVIDELARREMVTPAYLPRAVQVELDGRRVAALTFVPDRRHPQYAGRLGAEAAARVVLGAAGHSGANPDYLFQTLAHLDELSIRDPRLQRIADLVRLAL